MPDLRKQQRELQESAKAPRRTALVDTRLLGRPRTLSGALADWMSCRFTFTAYGGALSPDMMKLMLRAVATDIDGEIPNVQLSTADGVRSAQLFNVLVMCCEARALRTLERAGDAEGSHWVEVVGEGTRTRHCKTTRVVVLADRVVIRH